MAESPLRGAVQLDVCSPKAINGLFRIADEEQLTGRGVDLVPVRHGLPLRGGARAVVASVVAGRAWCNGRKALLSGGDEHGDLDLDRVGVLELVEQQVAIPAVK